MRTDTLIAIAAFLAVLILIAVLSFLTRDVGAAQDLQSSKYDSYLIQKDKEALDAAYHNQLLLLFSVWLKDDVRTTERVSNGLRIARRAYVTAAEQIERRERELQR
jgi:hypothetical protein